MRYVLVGVCVGSDQQLANQTSCCCSVGMTSFNFFGSAVHTHRRQTVNIKVGQT